VHSFDYDPDSVACTAEVRKLHYGEDPNWVVERGSVLDRDYLRKLGRFDIVYSWGVLHHTGRMWDAIQNAAELVTSGGYFVIAIYNDQGRASRIWTLVKRTYNRLPPYARFLVLGPAFLRLWGPRTTIDLLKGQPFKTWRNYSQRRGMSPWHDVVDWVGGYPFEVAKPEEVFEFCERLGFRLKQLKTWAGGHGCNEYVFQRER
jgi:SAM-dependent methyltransferase